MADQVCTRCVMDTSVPDIEFDGNGVCQYCRGYEQRHSTEMPSAGERAAALDRIVSRIKDEGRGKPYDCVVGISGGVDSSYLVVVAKELGLRPLAIHLDNGWNSELAVANIERLLNKLGIDLYTHVLDWNEFRDLQISFIRSGVANWEIPTDQAILALLYQIAGKQGVRFVISGSNLATEGIMPDAWMEDSRDTRLLRAIHRHFSGKRLKTYPVMSLPKAAWYTFGRGMRHVPLLNFVDYKKDDAVKTLVERYEWRQYGGKHYESIFTRFFQGYVLPTKYAMDKRRPHYSTLIMSGQMTRDEALQALEKSAYGDDEQLLRDDTAYVLKKLRLSRDEFAAIMAAPRRYWTDYPSLHWLFNDLAPVMRRVKNIGKRI